MPQLKIKINNRDYDVACEEGQEQRLKEVADLLSGKVDHLVEALGQVGEPRLLLMAGLLVADELYDTKADLQRANSGEAGDNTSGTLTDARAYVGQVFEELAGRMEGLIETLEPSVGKRV
ncbi:MAG: cell division protein ZapA [Alphaproteobacteria bacterium]